MPSPIPPSPTAARGAATARGAPARAARAGAAGRGRARAGARAPPPGREDRRARGARSAGSRRTSWTCAQRPSGGRGSRARSAHGARAVQARAQGRGASCRLTVSVAIPVLDGERYLEEVLAAVLRPAGRRRARGAGDRLGLARPLARDRPRRGRDAWSRSLPRSSATAARATSRWPRRADELVAFLTQDSTPADDGWLAAHVESFRLAEHVGASFGPHLPRPDASPLTKRLLTDFFHEFSPSGEPGGAPPRRHHLPVEQQLLHRAGRVGARSRSATSPTPRTRRSAPTCSPPAGPRSTTPRARVVHSHDLRADRGLPALLRRVPRPARQRRPEVGRLARARVRRSCARSVAADRAYLAREEPLAPGAGALDRPERGAPQRARGLRRARRARRPASAARSARCSRSTAAATG